ncbi:isochorismatase hydrolase [Gluconacetobacter diazotrophicus PA1 5]|uniref:Isochorismatase hydrolase n=2 Tax=Gluconacetobacter diazotrophicus TaxID=33996 RepID=A9H559_GLUDA|nr:isochorismatase family protein [Gluconacetobacter diazotrophicus]ACI52153.1 isochorismatase hydrolase [Gluconacetobacter diazotrophicus PA1 5]MBB2156915.1 isochorismatase family protein [Gluconacetobacter diazotrophicus]TWB02520.1 nicotinamidase-related amidase [Gluconacetobacter diazotrophicus]CAP54291.1 Isochorismatase hydrolase [Gluconacetobacter diazotrophicus PA1 5]
MTLTVLDPRTALVVIDLQKGIVGFPTVHPVAGIVASAAALAAAFRRRGLPVVLVNVTGGAPGRTERSFSLDGMPPDWADLVPELDAQPGDLRVTKTTWGAFASTDLARQLRALGVTQVVLAGIATSLGVESTAREAHAMGLNVTLALDAMTDLSPEAHDNSVQRIFPRLGETGSTRQVIDLLERG